LATSNWLDIDPYFLKDGSDPGIIERHNNFTINGKDGFDTWREMFADSARDAEGVVKLFFDHFKSDFPLGGHRKKHVKDVFTAITASDFEKIHRRRGSDAFNPWKSWWCGDYKSSNSSTLNYHIWDSTVSWSGQYVQPVSQSIYEYAYSVDASGARKKGNLQDKKDQAEVDLAINVSSKRYGLTGWVSKRQKHDKKSMGELPHVGYLLTAKRILWTTQPPYGVSTNTYWMFYERSNGTSRPTLYELDGIEFKMDSTKAIFKYDLGGARYYCQKPYSTECTYKSDCYKR
jgi:hypothetical protein